MGGSLGHRLSPAPHPEDKHNAHGKGPRTLPSCSSYPPALAADVIETGASHQESHGNPTLTYHTDCGHSSPRGTEVPSALSLQDLEAGLLQGLSAPAGSAAEGAAALRSPRTCGC